MEQPTVSNQQNKLAQLRKITRQKVRLLVAIAFWLHAIGISHLIRARLSTNPTRLRVISESALLALIFFYSYLASNGWWSLFFDLGYVYLFPVWTFAKCAWKLTKLTAGKAGRQLMQCASIGELEAQKEEVQKKAKPTAPTQPRDTMARPFQQFALLWCGVILLTDMKPLTSIGVVVTSMAIARAVASMIKLLNGSMEWLSKSQGRLEEILNKTVNQAMQQDAASKEFKSSVVSIRIYDTLLRWLSNREGIESWVQGASLLLLIPYYIYVCILSGFVYLGLAHVLNIGWTLEEALLDAMFMPLAWTDLPHSILIRTLAGLQVAILAFIGYEAIFHRISQKADSIAKAADRLAKKLSNPELQSKILIISQAPHPTVEQAKIAPQSATLPSVRNGTSMP